MNNENHSKIGYLLVIVSVDEASRARRSRGYFRLLLMQMMIPEDLQHEVNIHVDEERKQLEINGRKMKAMIMSKSELKIEYELNTHLTEEKHKPVDKRKHWLSKMN